MLWVLGIVLMDVFTVTVRRLARRRSPMAADRDHIHHMLLRRGYSAWQTLGLLVGVLPNWPYSAPYSASWGYAPSGIVGVLVLAVVLVWVLGGL